MPEGLVVKQYLINELKNAPISLIKEIYHYFEYLKEKLQEDEIKSISRLSEKKFSEIWNNDKDSVYDKFL